MKWTLGVLAVCVLGIGWPSMFWALAQPHPPNVRPRRVELTVMPTQNNDSILAIVRWREPPPGGLRRFPLHGYNVRAVQEVVGDTLAASYAERPAVIDSLVLVMPPLGESVVFYAALNSVDSAGQESAVWALSDPFTWTTTPLLPLPPESVRVDTAMGALILDSLQIVTHANAPRTPDGSYWIPALDTLRFAAVVYSGSVPVECCCPRLTDPVGTHPCDQIQLWSLRPLLSPGQTWAPYIRAPGFVFSGADKYRAMITMRTRGGFLLPEYLTQRRVAYASAQDQTRITGG